MTLISQARCDTCLNKNISSQCDDSAFPGFRFLQRAPPSFKVEGNTIVLAASFQACILTACVCVAWPGVSIAKTVTSAMQFYHFLPCCIYMLCPLKSSRRCSGILNCNKFLVN